MNTDIPGYTIIKSIAQGGMATVYYAVQESLNRPVALKILSPNLLADPSFGQRFLREARISGQLDHPQIVNVYDISQHESNYYICMEYFEGGDLKHKIDTQTITIGEAVQYAISLAQTLHYAHQQKFVHRDIKPANIMFRNNDTPVITDFGIARTMTSMTRMTSTGTILGTPMYMSPEQTQGREVDGRSDLYSLAIVLFELVTGRCPYEAESAIAIGVKQLSEGIPKLKPPFDAFQGFFNKALAKDPDERYPDGQAFAQALTEVTQNHPQLLMLHSAGFTHTSNDITIVQTRSSKSKYLAFSSLAIIALGAGIWWQQQTPSPEATIQAPPRITEQELNPVEEKSSLAHRLEDLLQEAQQLVKENQLTEPENNNALSTYQTLLKLDANYQPAIDGLAALALQLNQKIDDALQINDINKATTLLSQLEKADNGLANEARLRIDQKEHQLEQQRQVAIAKQKAREAEAQKQKLINNALTTTDSLLAQSNPTLLQLTTAYEYIQKILQTDPTHTLAKEKQLTIIDEAATLASNQLAVKPLDEQQLDQAQNTLNFILDLTSANHPTLRQLTLRHQLLTNELIKQRQQEENDRQTVIDALAKVSDLLNSTPLSLTNIVQAQNNLAIAKNLAPNTAKTQERQIASAYEVLTTNLLNNNEFESAEKSVQSGLEAFPNSETLADLAQQIKTAKKRQLRALPAF